MMNEKQLSFIHHPSFCIHRLLFIPAAFAYGAKKLCCLSVQRENL